MAATRRTAPSSPELARYIPASLADVRVAAMRLRAGLPDLSPSHARDLIAQMLGASNWTSLRAEVLELEQSASFTDQEVDADIRLQRRDAQARVLIAALQDLLKRPQPGLAVESGPASQTDKPEKPGRVVNATKAAEEPDAPADPTHSLYITQLAHALAEEVHASDPDRTDTSVPIDWKQRPPVARTDLLGTVAVNWWLRWRRTQLAGSEALSQTHEDVEQAERLLEIDVMTASPSSLIRLARAWGDLVLRPGAGQSVPEEATAFVLDRIAVEYACERARRADAWRAFTERRNRVTAAERNRIETEFDRELWSLACELLATQPCTAMTRKALENPGEFRDLAQRGRSRFEPGLRVLAKESSA